jgi:serine/threonine-protein kinase HipA
MKRAVTVCLGQAAVEVGTLVFEARGNRQSVAFSYAQDWLARADAFAISPELPLGTGYFYAPNAPGRAIEQSAFFGCFADTEPDGWGKSVIKRDYAKQRKEQGADALTRGTAQLNDFDFLLWVSDFSRVGALRLRDDEGRFQRPSDGKRDTPALIALPQLLSASKAVELNRETARDLAHLRGSGTSLGGLRPKCSILDKDGSLAIGKFPSVKDTRSVVHGEVLALELARRAGIDAAQARVEDSAGIPVAVVTRFDRTGDLRLMYLSARSLMQAAVNQQYSYLDIADAIRQHSSQAAADLQEIWRRMVFNIVINNVDDHLNNHGFLHTAHGQWRLAPAFDLNPFPDKERTLKTWISPDAGDEASVQEALVVAPRFQLSAAQANRVLDEVRGVVSGWQRVAKEIGMSASDIAGFAPAFI